MAELVEYRLDSSEISYETEIWKSLIIDHMHNKLPQRSDLPQIQNAKWYTPTEGTTLLIYQPSVNQKLNLRLAVTNDANETVIFDKNCKLTSPRQQTAIDPPHRF
jgi:hypothetical protein